MAEPTQPTDVLPTEATAPPAEVYPPLPKEDEVQAVQQPPADAPPPEQQPPPQQTTVVVAQAPVAAPPQIQFRERPVTFTDSSGQQVTTQLEYRSGTVTWIVAALICLLTGCICLVPIPFCINAAKDVYHINPNDGSVVGVYKRI